MKKYMKTAEVVGAAPWNMTVARDYLNGFCHRNEAGMVLSGWLEPLHFLNSASARLSQQERSNALGEAPASAEWHDFAPVGPKPVKVTLRPVAAQPTPPAPGQPTAAPPALSRVQLMDDDHDEQEPKLKAEPKVKAASSVPGPKVEPKVASSVPGPKVKVEPKVKAASSVPGPKVEPKVASSVPGPKVKVEPKDKAASSVPGPRVKVEPKVKLEQKAQAHVTKDGNQLPPNIEELVTVLHEKGYTTKDQIRDYFTMSAYDESYWHILLAHAANCDLFPAFIKYTVETHQLSNVEWSFGTDDRCEDMVDFMAYVIENQKIKTEPKHDLILPPPPPEERLSMKRPAASQPAGSAKAKAKLASSPKGKSKAKAKAKARHISPYRWPANRNGLGCPKCSGRWCGCGACRAFKAEGKPWPKDHVPRGFQFEDDDIA